MSKTVYLIAERNGFFAFGAGCSLTVSGGNLLAMSPSGFGIELRGFYREEQKASALLALWGSAIAAAPDGALLRWDFDQACVVDELAPDEEVFADDHLAPIDGVFGGLLPVPEALVEAVAEKIAGRPMQTYAPSAKEAPTS